MMVDPEGRHNPANVDPEDRHQRPQGRKGASPSLQPSTGGSPMCSTVSLKITPETVEHSPWSELHHDLLNKIAEFIYSFKDYDRARATCKAWNLKLPKVPKHIRAPLLVLALDDDTFDFDVEKITRPLRVSHLIMPELKNTLLRGSNAGWLVSVGIDDTLRLLNPFTRFHFNLPPISTFPDIVRYQPDGQKYIMNDGYTCEGLDVQKMHIVKMTFSCSPDLDKDFMAVAIYGEFSSLAFYRFGYDKWTHIPITHIFDDVTFHEGKFYALDNLFCLYEFDMKTPLEFINLEVPPPQVHKLYAFDHIKYLVWNHEGDLLLLIRHWKCYDYEKVVNGIEDKHCYKTVGFDIYKLNRSEKRWSKVLSLGDYVIVVGYNSSICMQPFHDDEGNWVRNCIYFSDDKCESQYLRVIGGHDVGVFNLQDSTINRLFPYSDFLYPAPIWISRP